MRYLNLFVSLIGLSFAAIASKSFAETVNIYSDGDAAVSQANSSTNYGGITNFIVGDFGGSDWEAYVHFDLSSIPSNAIITAAELRFYWANAEPSRPTGTLTLRQPTSSWSENSITWNNRPSSNVLQTDPVTSSDTSLSRKDIDPLNSNGIAYLQGIVSGTVNNYGFKLQWPNASTDTYFSFRTKESSDDPSSLSDF